MSAPSSQDKTVASGQSEPNSDRAEQKATTVEDDEAFKALHTGAIYEGKPPYIDPKGARGKPYGPPPIQEWADKLLGKRLIAETETGDSMVRTHFPEL